MTRTERDLLRALDRLVDWAMANRGTPNAFVRCYTYGKEVDGMALALFNRDREGDALGTLESLDGLDICLVEMYRDDAVAVLGIADRLSCARHVREAVEGLSGVDAPEDDIVRLRWVSEGGVHYSCTFPRAALLAALTGEGK